MPAKKRAAKKGAKRSRRARPAAPGARVPDLSSLLEVPQPISVSAEVVAHLTGIERAWRAIEQLAQREFGRLTKS